MTSEKKWIANSLEEPVWFAMSATFGRELKAKTFLESKAVKCFVPMRYSLVHNRRDGNIRKLVPAIHNLIFVYTTKSRIQFLKTGVGYLQYITRLENGKNVPIIVPDDQMEQFIAVCDTLDERLTYLYPNEIDLQKGMPVKIIGSIFDGIEGTFIKVDKSRKKRVVIHIQGIATVVIADITNGYIKVLE